MFELPDLPFDPASMSAFTSANTFSYHHGKHHAGYVKKLNVAVEGTDYAGKSLEDVVATSREAGDAKVFNNAAQHYNHSFFWSGLSPESGAPSSDLAAAIDGAFGSMDEFKASFKEVAATVFGSGWAWLVAGEDGELEILGYKDADTPLATDKKPLLTLDVWEHAYYLDHQNDRGAFIDAFFAHVNWEFVSKNYSG